MPKYRMLIAYDGSRFGGWQVQPNAISIQGLIQEALSTILRTPISIIGSGRTDAGVHAKGQCAHFESEKPIDTRRVCYSLNSLLPPDIRVFSLEPTSDDFHAQYSATGKIYHYHLLLDTVPDPFQRMYAFHVLHRVDLTALTLGARHLLGTHDFSSFANEASQGAAAKNAVRTLQRLDIVPETGGIRVELEADGFLYKMVRNIVGTLLDVGAGKISPDTISNILQEKDRRAAGKTAPPHGLFLMQVHYR